MNSLVELQIRAFVDVHDPRVEEALALLNAVSEQSVRTEYVDIDVDALDWLVEEEMDRRAMLSCNLDGMVPPEAETFHE